MHKNTFTADKWVSPKETQEKRDFFFIIFPVSEAVLILLHIQTISDSAGWPLYLFPFCNISQAVL